MCEVSEIEEIVEDPSVRETVVTFLTATDSDSANMKEELLLELFVKFQGRDRAELIQIAGNVSAKFKELTTVCFTGLRLGFRYSD